MSAMSRPLRTALLALVVVVLVGGAIGGYAIIRSRKRSAGPTTSPPATTSPTTSPTSPPRPARGVFDYGFDLSNQEPIAPGQRATKTTGTVTASDHAIEVMSRFAGSMMDESIYGFGLPDPEPSPGHFDFGHLAARIALIERAGGTAVISLVGAPKWMHPGSTKHFFTPPSPSYYSAFATLCSHVATAFPRVKYFVVWNEMKGFYNSSSHTWNYVGYTSMYNDVYKAIKRVRPTAMVGGPYANMTAHPEPYKGVVSSLHGSFGYLDEGMLQTVSYWLSHNAGADFVAVDGATENAEPQKGSQGTSEAVTNAVTAASLYANVDKWIESQTALPIWWMESHIQPDVGWTTEQGAAARIATLAEMASSGAAVGMQWQPQDQARWPDEGLWTSTLTPSGGAATLLAKDLDSALPIIRERPSLESGEPTGVLVGVNAAGVIAVNTNSGSTSAHVTGRVVNLASGQVLVQRA